MKTAIWILSIVIVILAGIAIWQWNIIKGLTPSKPATNTNTTGNNSSGADDGLASFANQLDATKKAIKDLEIKATFQP